MANKVSGRHRSAVRVAAAVLVALLTIVLIEVLLMALTVAGFREWYSYTLSLDYDAYIEDISEERIAKFRDGNHNSVLGWDTRPNRRRESANSAGRYVSESTNELGARTNPYRSEWDGTGPTVLVFGESYTFGAEVNDDETWTYRLSKLMQTEVINYGVSAFGPDQALLKMERKVAEHDPDIILFGIMSENINRLMSMYRPFYRKGTGVYLGFKPMLYRSDGGMLDFLPNPLDRLESRADVMRAYEIAKRYDYWYSNDKRPAWKFPFSLAMLKLVAYQAFYRDSPVNPFTRMREMWQNDEALARMDFVVRSVFRLAEEEGFVAAVVFIPNGPDVQSFVESGSYSYATYVQHIRDAEWAAGGQIIDILEHEFDYERFNVNRYAAHPSPYGTAVIADIIYGDLRMPQRTSAND